MRSSRPTCLVIILCLLAAASSLRGQEARLDSLRRSHAAAEAELEALVARRDSARAWADARYQAIPTARAEGGAELREALRAAQVAADSLAVLDALLGDALASQELAREALVDALEVELEAVLYRAEFANEPEAKADLLQEARELATELTRVQTPLELPDPDLPAVTVDPSDGPEEIALKADFLVDRAAQLRRAAEVVSGELEKRSKRAELQAEMRRLIAEVRLFDLARVPPSGSQAADAAQTAENRSSEFNAPAIAQDEVPPLERPLVERGVDLPTSGGPSADPGRERSVADELRRLRAELLRRAEALEARAQEIRQMLRAPP